jgi:hypothetical protein
VLILRLLILLELLRCGRDYLLLLLLFYQGVNNMFLKLLIYSSGDRFVLTWRWLLV